MTEKTVQKDEVIYHEGDVPDCAYVVLSGKVELVEINRGSETQMKIVEEGQTFGEYALFNPWSMRPVTARAIENNTILSCVSVEEFKHMLAQCPKALMPFLMPAFEKMKTTKVKEKPIALAILNDVSKVIITPVSDKLKEQFKLMDIPLARLPFRIGGYPEGGKINRQDQMHLYLETSNNPMRISRQHCEIIIENKTLIVSDLGSRFCTKVNGKTIGRGQGIYFAPLQKGTNEVILSPLEDDNYKFTVRCE